MTAFLRELKNHLKGKIAETIIEQLFRASGHKVRRFGQEYTLTNHETMDDPYMEAPLKVRSRPDFLISFVGKNREYLEVKFCRDGVLFPSENVDAQIKYWPETKIVVVSAKDGEPKLEVLKYPFFADGVMCTTVPLRDEWPKIKPELYDEVIMYLTYCDLFGTVDVAAESPAK